MIIGVLKENKANEARVIVVPMERQNLSDKGIKC